MRASGSQQDLPDALGVIPARYGSTRLPGKPLVSISGKPLIQHVYERARQARELSDLVVATDDERIRRVVEGFGGQAVMTSPEHPSGTDRMAEVALSMPARVYVNIQGDEPLLDAADVDVLVEGMRRQPDMPMGTLACPLTDRAEAEDPGVVKVVCDDAGRALYFSRAPIPYPRNLAPPLEARTPSVPTRTPWLKHIGIYAFRREFLLEFAAWPPGSLEQMEGLEQLRALERGRAIRVFPARGRYLGVDTPEDVIAVQSALLACP